MAAKKQQTHAKRARELAVKERRERKRAKKALRASGGLEPDTEIQTDWTAEPAASTEAP